MEVRIGAVASSQKFGVGMECCRDRTVQLRGSDEQNEGVLGKSGQSHGCG